MDSPLLSRTPPSPHKIEEERHTVPTPNYSILTTAAIILFLYVFFVVSVYLFNSEGYSGIKTFVDITPLTPVNKAFSCMFVLAGCWIILAEVPMAVFQLLDVQTRFMLAIARSRPRLGHYFFDLQKGLMHSYIKVIFVFGAVVIYIEAGAPGLYLLEELGLVDSLSVSVISVATTGYENPEFKTLSWRLFALFGLLLSIWTLTFLTGKSHERIARKLTVKD